MIENPSHNFFSFSIEYKFMKSFHSRKSTHLIDFMLSLKVEIPHNFMFPLLNK